MVILAKFHIPIAILHNQNPITTIKFKAHLVSGILLSFFLSTWTHVAFLSIDYRICIQLCLLKFPKALRI